MQTITIKVGDAYIDSFMSFLSLMPKKAIKIEHTSKELELAKLKKEIKSSFDDIEAGRIIDTKKTIKLSR